MASKKTKTEKKAFIAATIKEGEEVLDEKKRSEGLAGLAEREATPSTSKPSADVWSLVRQRIGALELSNEPLDTAIKDHRVTCSRKGAVNAAIDLCGFYAEAVISGEDKTRELDVCCTIAADLYARYPSG